MSNKLKPLDIVDISKKISWTLKDTKKAIKEFRNLESILNQDDFLKLCLNSENDNERIENTVQLLVKNSDNNVVNDIDAILNNDPFLYVLWTFKICDMVQLDYIDVEFWSDNEKKYQSGCFLKFPQHIRIFNSQLEDMFYDSIIQESEYYTIQYPNIYQLKKSIINRFISSKINFLATKQSGTKFNDAKDNLFIIRQNVEYELFLALIKKYKFGIFEYEPIVRYIRKLSVSEFLPDNDKKLRIIRSILSNRYETFNIDTERHKITDNRYWFFYCLIEKIKEKGKTNKTQPACKIVAKLFNQEFTSIRTRYYEKKDSIDNFDLDNCILEKGFSEQINEYLEKAESVK